MSNASTPEEVSAPALAPVALSKARPATVEDAPDSDDDARSETTLEDPEEKSKVEEEEDPVAKAIAAAERSATPAHDWQAVWAPAQNRELAVLFMMQPRSG